MAQALPLSSGATGVGLGLAGLGVAGSLLNQQQAKAPDISGLLNTINQGAQYQTGIASNLPGQLQALNAPYTSAITSAENTATNSANQQAQSFLNQLGNNQTLSGQDITKLLTQQAYSQVPQAQQAAREAAAASGGLGRGAAAELQAAPAATAASNVAQGLTQMDLAQQQQKAQALSTINNMSDQLITDKLGIDRDTATALYNSGNQDLINEANQLLGISQNQTAETLGAQQFGLTGQIAANAANAQAAQAPYQQLTGLGSALATAGMLSPATIAPIAMAGTTPSSAPIASGTTTVPPVGTAANPLTAPGVNTSNNDLLTMLLNGYNPYQQVGS